MEQPGLAGRDLRCSVVRATANDSKVPSASRTSVGTPSISTGMRHSFGRISRGNFRATKKDTQSTLLDTPPMTLYPQPIATTLRYGLTEDTKRCSGGGCAEDSKYVCDAFRTAERMVVSTVSAFFLSVTGAPTVDIAVRSFEVPPSATHVTGEISWTLIETKLPLSWIQFGRSGQQRIPTSGECQ